jgi:GTP 3',8-cyclase
MNNITSYGRSLHKLRVQLLDACNMRCLYCMPQKPVFLNKRELLGADELLSICSRLVQRGVKEIRLTGGEPLMREGFLEIVQGLSKLSLNKLCVTTNAMFLNENLLDSLLETKLRYINISLDSLNPLHFKKITGIDSFERVYENILASKKRGFCVKVNVVVIKGVNDDELLDFVRFAEETGIEVRFLELMRVGPNNVDFIDQLMTKQEMMDKISLCYNLVEQNVSKDNTAKEYLTHTGVRLGFIASESESFCSQCSRIRLTAKGELRSCLFKNDGMSVRDLDKESFDKVVDQIALKKPQGRMENISQAMNAIGG